MLRGQSVEGKIVRVIVETVHPLNDKQQTHVHKKLQVLLPTKKVECFFKLNPSLLSGIRLDFGTLIVDDSVQAKLNDFVAQTKESLPVALSARSIMTHIEKHLKDFNNQPVVHTVGHVVSVLDGVARVVGLPDLMAGELVAFTSGAKGIVLNLNSEFVDVIILYASENIREGESVVGTRSKVTVPVGFGLLGRVINALGQPVDDLGEIAHTGYRVMQMPAPDLLSRVPVTKPVHTGILGIDALLAIGKGQRELVIGDRQTGKTTLLIDMILSQHECNKQARSLTDKMFCVYVAIGQKQSSVRDLIQVLTKAGALEDTIIVMAGASESAAMQYLAPYAGCAIAEYFRDNGMNAMVFYDDLSKHATAYREMSLLLKRPAGREAYPGDVFYLHSRLLERAGQMSSEYGGGSLTAIPVIETQEGDVSAYIPTNVISITDGQIFLESSLFHQGIKPALNVGLSVSRVGGAAQTPIMKKIAASVKLELAQYREVLAFSQLSSDLDVATQKLLNRGVRLTEILKQSQHQPLSLAEEVVRLLVGTKGYLDAIDLDIIPEFLKGLYPYVQKHAEDVIESIRVFGDLIDDEMALLDQTLQAYAQNFKSINERKEE
ncbi:MAG: F0F1 ATP synthase subunit alpha [Alphaproteobacteria bacterium]|nr:F0F1 ATP synthase subunit alpha [Alphaproteobacteria bacterium]